MSSGRGEEGVAATTAVAAMSLCGRQAVDDAMNQTAVGPQMMGQERTVTRTAIN